MLLLISGGGQGGKDGHTTPHPATDTNLDATHSSPRPPSPGSPLATPPIKGLVIPLSRSPRLLACLSGSLSKRDAEFVIAFIYRMTHAGNVFRFVICNVNSSLVSLTSILLLRCVGHFTGNTLRPSRFISHPRYTLTSTVYFFFFFNFISLPDETYASLLSSPHFTSFHVASHLGCSLHRLHASYFPH